MTINKRIFAYLATLEDGQKKLSDYTGIPQQTISNWKSRGTTPSAKYLKLIAEFMGISLLELMGENKNPPAETESGLSADDKRWDKEMLTLFHKLNREGKSAAISMVLGITSNPQFVTEKDTEEAAASQTA